MNDVIELGAEGGAGSLVLCEVLKIHIDNILQKQIDPFKLKIVSRLMLIGMENNQRISL